VALRVESRQGCGYIFQLQVGSPSRKGFVVTQWNRHLEEDDGIAVVKKSLLWHPTAASSREYDVSKTGHPRYEKNRNKA
jgi:hypothetical protein